MQVIPAIDIMKGNVVRLVRGTPESAKSYTHMGNPVSIATRWRDEGAQIIHVVDLDAALGLGSNIDVVKEILAVTTASIQVGGGIRSLAAAQYLLDTGVERIILGSLAFREMETVNTLLSQYGNDRVMVALDHDGGSIVVSGWTAKTNINVIDALSTFKRNGVKLFLVTTVARDGTMVGPDLETLKECCLRSEGIIAAGGIGSVEDVLAVKDVGAVGVVIGKALYEGKVNLVKALRAVTDAVSS